MMLPTQGNAGPSLGCEEHARELAQGVEGNGADGWKFLGNGASRKAYLHLESQVVYKVEREGYTGWAGNNAGEHRLATFLRVAPMVDREAIYIPRTELYEVEGAQVLAMEYFARSAWTADRGEVADLEMLGLDDMCEGNARCSDDGRIVPIDLAFDSEEILAELAGAEV